MLKLIATPAVAAAVSICSVMLSFIPSAGAATIASRQPICMKVTDTYIKGGFLNQKFPAWLFTNTCNYAIYFYVEYPDDDNWYPSVQFKPLQALAYMSSGQPAKYVHVLECPSGWSAIGHNPKVCYR